MCNPLPPSKRGEKKHRRRLIGALRLRMQFLRIHSNKTFQMLLPLCDHIHGSMDVLILYCVCSGDYALF